MASGSLKKAQNRPQNGKFSSSWDLDGSCFGWILASKAYIHYGPWPLYPDESLKHLFMASGSLKKDLNRPQNGNFFIILDPLHLLRKLFWLDHGGSLPLKNISTVNLGYCVQMNP